MSSDCNATKSDSFSLSKGEEVANSISHGVGALLSVGALVVMIVLALPHSTWHLVSVSLFGASLIALYLASTLYHAIQLPKAKEVLRVFDHAFIFVLIAGSYMPWLLVSLRGPWGWSLLVAVTIIMIAGIILKAAFMPRFRKLGVILYVAMGWLICVAIKPLIDNTSPTALGWLVAGGLSYTIGVAFFVQKRNYAHFIWHLFVIAGSACHVIAVIWGLLLR